MTSLTCAVNVSVSAQQIVTRDLVSVSAPLSLTHSTALANGTGANQADQIYSDTLTITASATSDLDLTALVDACGTTISMARVKQIVVTADATNTNSVVIGAAAATQFVGPFGAATHTIAVAPGGELTVGRKDATGWAVSGSTKLLRFANSAGGTSVVCSIVIIGASA